MSAKNRPIGDEGPNIGSTDQSGSQQQQMDRRMAEDDVRGAQVREPRKARPNPRRVYRPAGRRLPNLSPADFPYNAVVRDLLHNACGRKRPKPGTDWLWPKTPKVQIWGAVALYENDPTAGMGRADAGTAGSLWCLGGGGGSEQVFRQAG